MEQVPLDFLGELRRTHTCGELRAADAGKRVILMGWVHRRRDLGGVLFIHLRDREGVTQLVFRSDGDAAVHAKAELLSSEYVIAIEGLVERRGDDTVNAAIETGGVDIALEPFQCTRFEMAEFAVRARESAWTTSASAAAPGPHHVRAMAEALGRATPASRYSPAIDLHPVLGTPTRPHRGDGRLDRRGRLARFGSGDSSVTELYFDPWLSRRDPRSVSSPSS